MSIYINVLIILLFIKYALNQWPDITKEQCQKSYMIISSILLVLFTGLRDQYTGADTMNYGNAFLLVRRCKTFFYAISEKTGRMETGYKIWERLVGYITDNVNVFFTLTAIFVAVCVGYHIYKNSKNPFFSMILYYTVGNFTFQMTGLRQSMAMAVLLISVEAVKEKKLIRFILLVWLASCFHTSAWSFLLVYPISYMKINLKSFVFYLACFIFALAFSNPISKIALNFTGYSEKYEVGWEVADDMGGITVIGMLALTLILCYIFFEKLQKQDKYNTVFFNITILSLIVYMLRYTVRIVERVSFYYQFAFIILLPNVIEAIPDTKTKRTVYTCAILLASLLFFYRYQIKPNYYGFIWG